MKKILIVFLLIALVVIIALGMTGFVPVLSDILGANKPRDLGVIATKEDLNKVMQDTGFVLDDTAGFGPDTKISYQGQKAVSAELSEKSLTALLNYDHADLFPVKNSQVKIHKDGTLEVSSNVSINNYKGYSLNNAVYAKGSIEVTSPRSIKINATEAEIGRIPVPLNVTVINAVQDEANRLISTVPGLSIESVTYSEGGVKFKGTIPAVIKRIKR